MNEPVDECVLSCLTTERGALPMFRGFGLAATDQRGSVRRAQVQEQLAKYYPDIDGLSVIQTDEHTYKVNFRGRYYAPK